MNRSITELCADLSEDQLTVIRDFLRDATAAGIEVAAELPAPRQFLRLTVRSRS